MDMDWIFIMCVYVIGHAAWQYRFTITMYFVVVTLLSPLTTTTRLYPPEYIHLSYMPNQSNTSRRTQSLTYTYINSGRTAY